MNRSPLYLQIVVALIIAVIVGVILETVFDEEANEEETSEINVTYNNNNGDIINFFAKYNLFLQKKPEGGYFLSLTK